MGATAIRKKGAIRDSQEPRRSTGSSGEIESRMHRYHQYPDWIGDEQRMDIVSLAYVPR